MDTKKQPNSEPGTPSFYVHDSGEEITPVSTAIPPKGPEGSITWTASEFIEHKKNGNWYLVLVCATVVIAGIIWLLTKDKITTATIVIVAIMIGLIGSKKPRELEYRVDNEGLHIAGRQFPFNEFRSFSVVRQGSTSGLVLLPLKRFSLLTTAYFDPSDEQKILDILSLYLPMEEGRRDIIDEIMWKLHF